MELALIEREISEGRAAPVAEGKGGKCYVVELDGMKFLHKEYPVFPPERPEVSEERACFNSFKFGMPSTCYINNNATPEQRAAKEFSTIQRWNGLNIPAPKPVALEGTRIAYEFMPGHSLANAMNGDILNEKDFGRILDCFHSVRNAAKKFKDIDLLHNDPFADNFFYDSHREVVVPLDPAKVIIRERFDITDGRINLFLLCKIFHLDTTPENQQHYLEQAVDRLTNSERETVAALNTDPAEARAYLKSQGTKWGADRLSIYYSRETLGAIQNTLIG